jgi:hypothetical protein
MSDIRHNLQQATRVDIPAVGAGGNVLALAVNVDQLTGCYPVNQKPTAVPPSWHYFCTRADAVDPTITDLYHHTGAIAGNGTWCGNLPTAFWNAGNYPVPICGQNQVGQTVTLIMQFSVPAAAPNSGVMFSRIPAAPDNVYERDSVLVTLRSRWIASQRGFGASQRQRDVDFTLASQVKITSPNQ